MKRALYQLFVLWALLQAQVSIADTEAFTFSVIPGEIHASNANIALQEAIRNADAQNLAFVVVQGIKPAAQACTDSIYSQKKALLQTAKHGLIVSFSGSDWAACKSDSNLTALARLNRLREMFFVDEFSMGGTRLPLIRQSTIVQFRSFAENTRWALGRAMFATINLPAPNNHYIVAAGRNSEFEDRLIANRDWLNRVFLHAAQAHSAAIVLFSDGNPLSKLRQVRRDGYVEIRQKILKLAAKFPGKVLIVHTQPPTRNQKPGIVWRNNIGEIGTVAVPLTLSVRPHPLDSSSVEIRAVDTKEEFPARP